MGSRPPSLAPANGKVTVAPGMLSLARIFVVPARTKVECVARFEVATGSPTGTTTRNARPTGGNGSSASSHGIMRIF